MAVTAYSEVRPGDTDVAVFVAAHPEAINPYNLPVKMWVARGEGQIVALLMLKTVPYTSLDLIRANTDDRPFMRILRLYKMAEAWLQDHNVPIVCVSIHDSNRHFQSLVRRLGFEKVGAECNVFGEAVETIFAKKLTKKEAA